MREAPFTILLSEKKSVSDKHDQSCDLNIFTKDEWLSEQLGKHAYKFFSPYPQKLSGAPSFFGYAKIPARETALANEFLKAGFRLVEVLKTYRKKPAEPVQLNASVRPSLPSDRPEIENIARRAFWSSRFHQDTNFSKDFGSRLKSAWVGNFFEGKRGDRLLVAQGNNTLHGFVLLLETKESTIVDLIAVDPFSQGKGYGQALLASAEKKERTIQAGTQEINRSSCRLYEKCGYSAIETELVFHLHQ